MNSASELARIMRGPTLETCRAVATPGFLLAGIHHKQPDQPRKRERRSMNEETTPVEPSGAGAPPSAPTWNRSWWLPVAVLLGVFLVGFVPMWLKSGRLNAELSRTQRQVRAQEIQLVLADAALDARRGDYEPARQRLASFFVLVHAELDRGLARLLQFENLHH